MEFLPIKIKVFKGWLVWPADMDVGRVQHCVRYGLLGLVSTGDCPWIGGSHSYVKIISEDEPTTAIFGTTMAAIFNYFHLKYKWKKFTFEMKNVFISTGEVRDRVQTSLFT